MSGQAWRVCPEIQLHLELWRVLRKMVFQGCHLDDIKTVVG